jgi:phage tail protein X
MTIEILTVKQEETPLDLLIWRRLQKEYPGLVDATYEANPGLADLGTFLPVGTKVKLTLPDTTTRTTKRVVRLWGGG